MRFSVAKQGIQYSTYQDAFYEHVYFEIENTKRDSITIADQYVFSSHASTSKKGLKECKGSFVVKQSDAPHLAISKDAIGAVSFFEEMVGEFGEYYHPPKIIFEVYVDKKLYEELKDNVKKQIKVTHLTVDCDRGLEFGWEPDGSTRVWKIDESKDKGDLHSKLEKVEITSFGMGFGENPFEDDSDELPSRENIGTTSQQELLKNVKDIHGYVKQIGTVVIAICVILVLQAVL